MSEWTGMGPNTPAPKQDPNCQCICHTQPGVMHVAACCAPPMPADLTREGLAALAHRLDRIADEIDEQVKVTRAYVADCGMDFNQRELMRICTSHFINKARSIRAEAAAIRGEGK